MLGTTITSSISFKFLVSSQFHFCIDVGVMIRFLRTLICYDLWWLTSYGNNNNSLQLQNFELLELWFSAPFNMYFAIIPLSFLEYQMMVG
jgi:hypothetical protein